MKIRMSKRKPSNETDPTNRVLLQLKLSQKNTKHVSRAKCCGKLDRRYFAQKKATSALISIDLKLPLRTEVHQLKTHQ